MRLFKSFFTHKAPEEPIFEYFWVVLDNRLYKAHRKLILLGPCDIMINMFYGMQNLKRLSKLFGISAEPFYYYNKVQEVVKADKTTTYF